jgi:hypothetical protein
VKSKKAVQGGKGEKKWRNQETSRTTCPTSHGADYGKVMANVAKLIELKKTTGSCLPRICLKAILFAWNDNDADMQQFRSDAQSMGLSPHGIDPSADSYVWSNDATVTFASDRIFPGAADGCSSHLASAGELQQ